MQTGVPDWRRSPLGRVAIFRDTAGIMGMPNQHPMQRRRRQCHPSVRDESEPRPITMFDRMRYNASRERLVGTTVADYVRGKKQIVHGARAMNVQVPQHLRRHTDDWDIYSKQARKNADRIEDELDEIVGCDMFYVKVIDVADADQLMYRVVSRADNQGVIDYMAPKTGEYPPYIVVKDVKYETLKSLKKKAIRNLRDPRLTHRHRKAREDLARIKQALREMERENPRYRRR